MDKIVKIIAEGALGLVALMMLGTMYIPNLVITICIAAFIWIMETQKLTRANKVWAGLGILLAVFAYLWIPKPVTGCGVLSTGTVCSTTVCQGLPEVALTSPVCWGWAVKEHDR